MAFDPALGSPDQAGVYAVAIIFIVASLIVVAARFTSRHYNAAEWRADDWLILATMLLLWGLAIMLIYGAAISVLGTHTLINPRTGQIIPTWKESKVSELENILQLLAIIALGTLKTSVVLLYRRIFIGKRFQMVSLIVLITLVAWAVAFFFATLFECNGGNYDALWLNPKSFKLKCGRYKYIQLGHCVSDVATDLIVLAMPLPPIWGLRMSIKRKLILSFIFLLGLLTTAAGTARLVIVAEDLFETTTGARDVRGAGTNIMVWTFVEIGVGVVASCLPTMKQVFDRRNIQSAVASVRSALSLTSQSSSRFGSQRDGTQRSGTQKTDESGYSRFPYEEAPLAQLKSDHSSSTVSHTQTTGKKPTYPANAILRQDSVTLQRDMA